MNTRLSVSALALFLACASPEVGEEAAPSPEKAPAVDAEAGAVAPAPPPAEAEAVAAEPDPVPAEPASRRLTEDARAQMIEILSRESDGERRIWIAVTAGQAEPIALRSQFRAMFEEAGIGVEEVDLRGLRLKPGLRVLIAEESFPLWVSTFLEAFDATEHARTLTKDELRQVAQVIERAESRSFMLQQLVMLAKSDGVENPEAEVLAEGRAVRHQRIR